MAGGTSPWSAVVGICPEEIWNTYGVVTHTTRPRFETYICPTSIPLHGISPKILNHIWLLVMGLPRKPKPQRNEISLIVNLPLSRSSSSPRTNISFFPDARNVPPTVSSRHPLSEMLVPRTLGMWTHPRLGSDRRRHRRCPLWCQNWAAQCGRNILHVLI